LFSKKAIKFAKLPIKLERTDENVLANGNDLIVKLAKDEITKIKTHFTEKPVEESILKQKT